MFESWTSLSSLIIGIKIERVIDCFWRCGIIQERVDGDKVNCNRKESCFVEGWHSNKGIMWEDNSTREVFKWWTIKVATILKGSWQS